MRVYRVEERNGHCGPFTGKNSGHFISLWFEMHSLENFPGPCRDGLVVVFGEKFACPTFELIFEWFGEHIEWLKETGYVLKVFEVASCVKSRSGKQVLFDYEGSTLVEIMEF